MKSVKKMITRLKTEKDFMKRFPVYNENDDKKHVLFLGPTLNTSGYYRMILPALELNNTKTHRAIVSNIHKLDFNKQFNDYDTAVDERLIKWANYIVFPTMLTDISYIIKEINDINEEVEYFMDIDTNYFAFPENHPQFKKISENQLLTMLDNFLQTGIITAPNKDLLKFYDRLIRETYKDEFVFTEFLPNLISHFGYQNIEQINRNGTDKIRLGIIANAGSKNDLLAITNVLKQVNKQHGNNVEVIIFGWDGKHNDTDLLKDIKFTYEKPVKFLDYFQKLNELMFDLALIPIADIPYNTQGKSFTKYLELSHFEIPVIASKLSLYQNIITDGENGFLADSENDWLEKIDMLINDKNLRHSIGGYAHRFIWENLSYTKKNLYLLQEIFH